MNPANTRKTVCYTINMPKNDKGQKETIGVEINRAFLTIRTDFEALHKWKEAPPQYSYLSRPHRHLFKVTLCLGVNPGADREIEFIDVKQNLRDFTFNAFTYPCFENKYVPNVWEYSCEEFAKKIGEWAFVKYPSVMDLTVEVTEDGENGAYLNMSRLTDEEMADLKKLSNPEVDVCPKPKAPAETSLPNVIDNTKQTVKPFFGLEAEGPYQEIPTLFVPITPEAVEGLNKACFRFKSLLMGAWSESLYKDDFVYSCSEIWKGRFQIYIGAGNCPLRHTTDPLLFAKILAILKEYFIFKSWRPLFTLEADVPFAEVFMPKSKVQEWAKNPLHELWRLFGDANTRQEYHSKVFVPPMLVTTSIGYAMRAADPENLKSLPKCWVPDYVKTFNSSENGEQGEKQSVCWYDLKRTKMYVTNLKHILFSFDTPADEDFEETRMKNLKCQYVIWLNRFFETGETPRVPELIKKA